MGYKARASKEGKRARKRKGTDRMEMKGQGWKRRGISIKGKGREGSVGKARKEKSWYRQQLASHNPHHHF